MTGRIRTPKQLTAQIEDWNARHPAGTLVKYYPVRGRVEWETRTTATLAYMLSGHTAVIKLTGKAGCVALDHCVPYPPVPDFTELQS